MICGAEWRADVGTFIATCDRWPHKDEWHMARYAGDRDDAVIRWPDPVPPKQPRPKRFPLRRRR